MDITLSSINLLAAFPLGFVALLSFVLGLRRGTRFFDHESNAGQRERLRDLILSAFDIVTMVFCLLLIMSPVQLWFAMIPIGLAIFIFAIPISLLGGYYHLYVASGFMPKNAGIKIQSSIPNEAPEKLAWYEFTPLAFIVSWLIFFLVNTSMIAIGGFAGTSPELNGLITIISILVGTTAGAIVILGSLLKSKWDNKMRS